MKTSIKTSVPTSLLYALCFSACVACLSFSFAEDKKASYDEAGRFSIYNKSASPGAMPFIPYGVMPAEAGPMVTMDAECKVKPNPEDGEKPGDGICFKMSIAWAKPFWCGVAFLSGPDSPPWWGEDDRGDHYDFSTLKNKKLVFHCRGEKGGERIQVKFAVLGDKKHGDSAKFPAETKWLKLTTEWQRFELDLNKYKPSDLARIANAMTIVCNKVQQEGSPSETVFYLDTIYLE